MKKLFSSLAIVIVLAGCHKEHTSAPVQPKSVSKRIAKIIYDESPDADTWFTYDASGRMTGFQNSDVIATVNFNGPTASFSNVSKADNKTAATGNFILDNNGNATHFEMYYSNSPSSIDTSVYNYEYDADGYMKKTTAHYQDGTGSEMILEYANGNMSKQIFTNNGVTNYWIYTYSPLEDKTGYNTNFTLYTNCMAGKRNKNLLIKAEEFDQANNKVFEVQYVNEVDKDGYLVKKTTNFITYGTTVHNTYKYE